METNNITKNSHQIAKTTKNPQKRVQEPQGEYVFIPIGIGRELLDEDPKLYRLYINIMLDATCEGWHPDKPADRMWLETTLGNLVKNTGLTKSQVRCGLQKLVAMELLSIATTSQNTLITINPNPYE